MGFLSNFLSSVIILGAIPLLLVATVSIITNRTIFSERYVKEQAEEQNVYAGIVDLAQNAPREGGSEGGGAEIGAKVAQYLTPTRVKEIFEPAIGQLFRSLRGQQEFQVVLDLRSLKAEIRPQLTGEERRALDEEYPDELNLAKAQRGGEPESIQSVRRIYRLVQGGGRYLPFIVLGLLVLLALINHGRSRLRRPAYVFLIAGLLLGSVGGLALLGVQFLLRQITENASLPKVLQESAEGVARSVGGDVTRLLLIFGAGYIVLAILLFIGSFFIRQPVRVGGSEDRTYDPKRGSTKR